MHSVFLQSKRHGRRVLLPLILALAVSEAYAATDVRGATGAAGRDGTPAQVNGGNGGAGAAAVAVAGNGDAGASAYGGSGGKGGQGASGSSLQDVGNGGNGGNGGAAEARHVVRSSGGSVTARAQAQGGLGGNYGEGGYLTVEPWTPGVQGTGGNGGDAKAVIDAVGTGTVNGTAIARGGDNYWGPGGAGGNGAVALNGTGETVVLAGIARGGNGTGPHPVLSASGHGGSASGSLAGSAGVGGLNGSLNLTGGDGGPGAGTLLGARGGDVSVRDPFNVSTTGQLVLSLTGTGGRGGRGAGSAGKAELDVTIAGNRASSVTLSASATGGMGGSAKRGGTGAEGAIGRSSLHASGAGPVTVTAQAVGGIGGSAGDTFNGMGARGGLGIANAAAFASGTGAALSSAIAIGGQGGSGQWTGSPDSRAGDGGGAQGTAYAEHSAGGLARASLSVTGGAGGSVEDGTALPGNGASVNVVDSVAGYSAGKLELVQEARGGAGGVFIRGADGITRGVGGDGGNAVSRLTWADTTSSDLEVRVSATGGKGGYGSRGTADSLGKAGVGEAVLKVTSTKAGAQVLGSATATAGEGLRPAGAHIGARSTVTALGRATSNAFVRLSDDPVRGISRGTAYARAVSASEAHAWADGYDAHNGGILDVRAESQSTGGESRAYASGSGRDIDVSAYSATSGTLSYAEADGWGKRAKLRADANATIGGWSVRTSSEDLKLNRINGVNAVASADIGQQGPGYVWPGVLSLATLVPMNPTSLDATPHVAAAFETLQRVGEGRMMGMTGIAMTAGEHMKTSANFLFKTTQDGALTLGLLGFNEYAMPLGQLGFSVFSHGTELFARTFASADDARAFFVDNTLSLGTFTAGYQDILITADYLFNDSGRVEFSYVLGAEALAPVPEPGTWMMVLLGMTVVAFRVRRRG